MVVVPSGFVTSRWTHEWGLTHSKLTILPVSVTTFDWSYSAEKEWCATSGIAARSTPMPMISITGFVLIDSFLLFGSRLLSCQTFGQLDTRPDRIHNECDLQTDGRYFTKRRIECHAGGLKILHERFEILDLE